MSALVTRDRLIAFLTGLDSELSSPARLFLVGESTQLLEGWREWTDSVECTAEVEPDRRARFDEAVATVAAALDVRVVQESPADVIPLPEGYRDRARPLDLATGHIELFHFDPYSVVYRFVARGDEPDYHLALAYLEHGWVSMGELDARLAALLPRFTRETIQQDPAEFRRRYKGLSQMWEAIRPGVTHRHTPA